MSRSPTRAGECRVLGAAPAAMSVVALAICALAAAGVVVDPPGDEGAMAHLYQLIVLGQLPIVGMFARRAVRRRRRHDLTVLAAQLALLLAALVAVPLLGL